MCDVTSAGIELLQLCGYVKSDSKEVKGFKRIELLDASRTLAKLKLLGLYDP